MSKGFRITLLIILALLILGAGFVAAGSFMLSGFQSPSFHKTLTTFGSALFVLLAVIFYIKLVLITKNPAQASRGKEISNFVLCFFFILLAVFLVMFAEHLWCFEALVRNIELLPGGCWYN